MSQHKGPGERPYCDDCHCGSTTCTTLVAVRLCPLHAQAEAMRKALAELVGAHSIVWAGWETDREIDRAMTQARAILAATEPQP